MNPALEPLKVHGRVRISPPSSLGLAAVLLVILVIGARQFDPGAAPSNPSGPPAVAPTAIADPAQQFFATTSWVAAAPDRWVLGRAGEQTVALPAKLPGSVARLDWGHVVIATIDEAAGTWTFLVGDDADRSFAEVYVRDGFRADVQATIDPAGQRLFYSVGTGTNTDGGVYAVDLVTKTEQTLVPPGPASDPSSRIRLEWSPSGRTLASSLCGFETCAIDVVDPSALTAHRLGSTAALLTAVSDSYALATNGTHGGWVTVDLATGAEVPLAAATIADAHEGWALPDGRFVISGWTAGYVDYVVEVVSVGEPETTILTQPASGARLLQRIGLPGPFVLIGPELGDLVGRRAGALDILDLGTGLVRPGAFQINP